MAIIPGEQKRRFDFIDPQQIKQKRLIFIFLLVLLVIAAILYFGYFRKPPAPPLQSSLSIVPVGGINIEDYTFLKNIEFETPILLDKKFQSLTLPGQFPIVVGEKGREDPFAPF